MTNRYQEAYDCSIQDPEKFWGDAASEIDWVKPWDRVLDDRKLPFYCWFSGAECNTCYNALDRHADGDRGSPGGVSVQHGLLRQVGVPGLRKRHRRSWPGAAKGDRARHLPGVDVGWH